MREGMRQRARRRADLRAGQRAGGHRLRRGARQVASGFLLQVVDEDFAPVLDAPGRQRGRVAPPARAGSAAPAVDHGIRDVERAPGPAHAFTLRNHHREHRRVHQHLHVFVQGVHDRLDVEVRGQAPADVGQQRDVAARLVGGVLLLLGLALAPLGRLLLQQQLGGARTHLALQPALLLDQGADAVAVGEQRRCTHQGQRRQAEPPGLPPGRRDGDRQRGRRLAPDAVLVAGAYAEHVVAGVQVGIAGEALAGIGLDPAFVEAFELVGVAVAARRRVVQRRELEREHRIAVRQGHAAAPGQRTRLVEHREGGDAHQRRIRVVADRVRLEGIHAVDAAEV